MITERVHSFGEDDALVGIVTLPATTDPERPLIVLLNAGLVHRVGPFGMAVELARSLANAGFGVLRFDQSGLGDSPARTALPIERQVVLDGRAALDLLAQRYGARRFVVGGLCSGAINAQRVCLADPRVIGMWMLDGYAYPTARFRRIQTARRLRSLESWKRLGRALADRVRARLTTHRETRKTEPAAVAPSDDRKAIFYQDWPPIADARREIEHLLERGVRMLFVYTAGWSSFVDARQFDEMFPRLAHRDRVTLKYYPTSDHTYFALDDRAAMIRDVGRFVSALPRGSADARPT